MRACKRVRSGDLTHVLSCSCHMHMYTYTYARVCVCVCECTCACVGVHICVRHTHTHTHTHNNFECFKDFHRRVVPVGGLDEVVVEDKLMEQLREIVQFEKAR